MPFPDERETQPYSQLPGTQEQRYIQHVVKVALEIEMGKLRTELTQSFKDQSEAFQREFKSAFPDGDLAGHKRFHDQLVESQKERKALAKEIRTKAVTGVLWVAAALVATAIWEYIKREVHK